MDLDASQIAGVTSDGRRVILSSVTGADGLAPRTVLSEGVDLLHPAWDKSHRMWVVDRRPGGAIVSVVQGGRSPQWTSPESPERTSSTPGVARRNPVRGGHPGQRERPDRDGSDLRGRTAVDLARDRFPHDRPGDGSRCGSAASAGAGRRYLLSQGLAGQQCELRSATWTARHPVRPGRRLRQNSTISGRR